MEASQKGPGSREWSGGLFNCCLPAREKDGCTLCCQAYWCSCVTFGQSMQMAGLGSCLPKAIMYLLACFGIYSVLNLAAIILLNQTTEPDKVPERTIMNLSISASIMLFVCVGVYAGWHRSELRKKFGLKGGVATDCLQHACCHECALCQEYRTISINVNGGKWTGPAVGGPTGMVPPSGQYM